MKNTLTILLVVLTTSVFAIVPQKMSYQAVVRNSSNALVVNSNIGMQVSILQNSATGTSVYVERQFPTTNANGLVTIEIGSGTLISGSFSTIDWSTGIYFIKTETDLNGGANYTITGTSQLLTVPYALYAQNAGNGFSGSYTDLSNKPTSLSGYGITDAVNITNTQTIAGVKTFSNLPIFNNGIKFSDNTTLTSGNVGNWKLDGTKNFTDSCVEIGKGNLRVNNMFQIGDYDSNSHIGQLVLNTSPIGSGYYYNSILYGRYLYGTYGHLVIQANSTEYASTINFVTGSNTATDNNPPLQRMVIWGNGNVGIGFTTYAKSKLEINGDVYIDNSSNGVILKSPNGTCWRVTVDNTGNLVRTQITTP